MLMNVMMVQTLAATCGLTSEVRTEKERRIRKQVERAQAAKSKANKKRPRDGD
jgi:hypothetical protein